jgi:hypothetical protein
MKILRQEFILRDHDVGEAQYGTDGANVMREVHWQGGRRRRAAARRAGIAFGR